MNRRGFLAAAVGAVLAPTALLERPGLYDLINVPAPAGGLLTPATFTWWRNNDDPCIFIDTEMQVADMERLWRECMSYPAPSLIRVDQRTYEMVREYAPEMFT